MQLFRSIKSVLGVNQKILQIFFGWIEGLNHDFAGHNRPKRIFFYFKILLTICNQKSISVRISFSTCGGV
jgi:hypothetical protein